MRTTRGGENSSLSAVQHTKFSLGLGQRRGMRISMRHAPTLRHVPIPTCKRMQFVRWAWSAATLVERGSAIRQL